MPSQNAAPETAAPDGLIALLSIACCHMRIGVPIGSGILPIAALTRSLVAGGLDRIILSSVWAYQAPMRDWRGDGAWGEGVFRAEQPPFDPLQRPWDADALAARDPLKLVELEYEAVEQGQAWLRAMLREIGTDVRTR